MDQRLDMIARQAGQRGQHLVEALVNMGLVNDDRQSLLVQSPVGTEPLV